MESQNIEIYLDSANLGEILHYYRNNKFLLSGFTTNPTLMKNAGVKDYLGFIKELVSEIKDLPISFEVFADEFDSMQVQAEKISSFGDNIFVKIPITNTKGKITSELVSKLNSRGVKCNVTAIMTVDQVRHFQPLFNSNTPVILSIFAGRIADTGRNPEPILKEICELTSGSQNLSVLWASTRELLNIFQAEQAGCQIITVSAALLNKITMIGMDLNKLSLETVEMFYKDAIASNFTIL